MWSCPCVMTRNQIRRSLKDSNDDAGLAFSIKGLAMTVVAICKKSLRCIDKNQAMHDIMTLEKI